jgi:type II secretory pathway pseudopilin PulG
VRTSLAHAHARAPRSDDAGISLVETLVAMVIGSLLLGVVVAFFVASTGAVRRVNAATAASSNVRVAAEAMSRTLRVAYPPPGEPSALVTATSTDVMFYSLLNRGTPSSTLPLPTRVEYTWDGNCLNQAQTPARPLATPSATGSLYAWDTGRTSTCLLRTTRAPVLSYYTTGVPSSGGTTTPPLTMPPGGLDVSDRQAVQSVQVTLTAAEGADDPSASAAVRVTLQNIMARAEDPS